MAKRMEPTPIDGDGNAASSTPIRHTRIQTSLSAAETQNAPASPALVVRPASVRRQAIRKVRHSDPGPFHPQAGLSTAVRKRGSMGTSSDDGASGAPSPTHSTIVVTPSRRRRSALPTRSHRRHTFAVAPTRKQFASPSPEAISQEIQFFPLKQALSARTRRALRRNALSEEMNDIDEEKRAGLTKNRIELIRTRRELAELYERIGGLERALAAARHAPSEEPESAPLPSIDEEQDHEDLDMGFAPDDTYLPQSPDRRSSSSAEPQVDSMEVEAPVPKPRDQKIKDLESMIQTLRDDIAQRVQEERLRAQEDEVFHDAEEQIMHEENYALVERIQELTATKAKKVSFDDDVEDIGAEDDDDGYMGPLADDFEDDVTDTEGDATFRSSGTYSPISPSQTARANSLGVEADAHTQKIGELEIQNDRLRQTIETLGGRIQDIEAELDETQMSVGEREKAFNKLKRENEKLRNLETELEQKITELEEMEGERLETVNHMMVQTDEAVDEERIVVEGQMDILTKQVAELQDMIRVVTVEKLEAEARIAVASSKIVSLQAAAESDEASKLEAETQIRSLTTQIADLEDTVLEEYQKTQDRINDANAQIADLQRTVETGEAARLRAEAKILTVTNEAKNLESAVSEKRSEVEARIMELEAVVETDTLAKTDAEVQIATLTGQIREREFLISEVKSVAQAQIADYQALVEASEVAKAESEARILTLNGQVEVLEASAREQTREAEATIAAGNARVAALQAAVEAGEVTKAEAEAQILILKSQIEDLKADALTLAEEKAEMQKEIEELSEKVKELEAEVWGLREENAEMKREVTTLAGNSKEFEGAANILRQDKASLEKHVESLETKVGELEDAAKVLIQAKASLETEFINLNSQLYSQQTAAERAEGTLEEFERNIIELRSRIEVFEQAADTSKNEKASLEQDILSLRAQVSSLENGQKLAEEENRDLQKNINELNAQIGSFKQAIEAADLEKQQLENAIVDSNAQVEALKRAAHTVSQEKEALEHTLTSLNNQLSGLATELDTFRAENNLFKEEIENHKSEIGSLKRLLELSSQEKDALHHDIRRLEDKVVSLEVACMSSNEQSRDLRSDIEILNVEIKTLKQASVIADEEKSIIQQKIRPYIQGEQSLDMAVEEVLTELVMAKNRADENERIKTELFNKIRILAQNDESDAESINPEEMVERLTDCFREVRNSVEKLYESHEQTPGGPFEGHDLGEFAWTGSNESSLAILGKLVGDLCKKVTGTQAQAQEMRDGWQQEQEQRKLYGSYLENIAIAVGDEDQELPEKDQTLRLVTLRLLALKKEIDATKEKVEELNDSVARRNSTIKDLEVNIDNTCKREMELSQKLVDSISAHDATTTRLYQAHTDIQELGKAMNEKDETIGRLGVMIDKQADKERGLLERIQQQEASHNTAVSKLEQGRDEAVADLEKKLTDLREAKANVEHLASQAYKENALVVKTLQETIAASQAELEGTNSKLKETKASHQEIVEQLEGRLAHGRGELSETSRKLRETIEKSANDILALETKLKLSEDEVRRQKSSLDEAVTERDNATKKFNTEIQSSHDAIASLEKEAQAIRLDAKIQHEGHQMAIASLKAELQATKDTAEVEKKILQDRIHSQTENINKLQGRIHELEEMLEETEDSQKALAEHLKATESQSQLFQEEASKAQQALEVEKRTLQQNLVELKLASETLRTETEANIMALGTLVEEKSQRIQELETVVSTLQSEKLELEQNINELDEEFEVEQRKGAETIQSLANEATKFMARFGDVKNQSTKNHRLRRAEGIRNSRKRAREEQEAEEGVMRMPPTPASSVVASAIGIAKRDSKRRKYDSGVGVEEDDEEFEGVSQVGA